jgi:cyclic-di-AMP phosphodiesterase
MDRKIFGIFIPRASFYLWVILVFVIIIAFMNWQIAIPAFIVLLILVYHNIRSNITRQREITKYIENLTFNIDSATKDTLLNFPMPLVVVELDATVVWYNSSFKSLFGGEELLDRKLDSVVQDFHPGEFIEGNESICKQVSINGREYNILGSFVKIQARQDSAEYILLLYFIDNTELVNLKKKYDNERVVAGIIIIDNYDDLMQNMDEDKRPQMLAEIGKIVSQWVGFTGGILKKFERDKYLFLFEYRYLNEMQERKFDVLDNIKEIDLGNKIPVTLSMGFGINADTLLEALSYAAAAIDIALGRGGDQAVIKDGERFSFFGGKTRELEKRTRVKARVMAYALRELIDQFSDVIIMGHENADLDSIGSAMGIYRIAKNRGKKAYIALKDSNTTIEPLMERIRKSHQYEGVFVGKNEAIEIISSKSLLVIVDTYRGTFTEFPELLERTENVVVIDHHRKGADFIHDAILTYQETYASSACELVTELLQYVDEKLKLGSIEAEALLAGIVVDTKNFAFKTGVRTFEAASFLRRQGADTISVRQLLQNSLETYLQISNIVENAEIIDESVAISVCPPDIRNAQIISAKAADELLNLSGFSAAFVLSRINNQVYISGRSLGEINVQVILEKLGGGGHMTVAGAQLEETSVEEAKEKLKYAITSKGGS